MTQVLNLAQLKKEAPLVIVDENNVRHEMSPPTLERMIKHLEIVEKLGTKASMQDEIRAGIDMVVDAFPTLKRDDVMKWTLEQIQTVTEMARGASGEVVTTDAEEATSGNDPKAT